MTTIYSKIHYAAKISTDTSITAEDIGMYNGVIRFITDGYIPTNATYEDLSPIDNPTKWFDNFLTQNGVGTLGSKIDLSIGGDYAYLQSTEIDIMNYTSNGKPYHIRINELFSTIITGSKLTVYVIIDDVFYERWNGVVSGTQLNDSTYTFIGADSHNNTNDTLSGKTVGFVIGAEYTYLEVETEAYANNVILRRFGPYWYGTSHIHSGAVDDKGNPMPGATGHPLKYFNGFANATLGDIEPTGVRWLQIEKNQYSMDFMSMNVVVGDLIQINDSTEFYEILSWDTYTGTSVDEAKEYHIHINVRYFDKSLADFTACFTDAYEFKEGTEAFDGLATLKDSARLSFYKKAKGTGIPASMITGKYVTIIDSTTGKYTNMTYTILSDGTIRLDDIAYTTRVTPSKVEVFKTYDTVDEYQRFKSLDDNLFDDITLPNSLDSNDYFIPINGDDTNLNNIRTTMFKLTFPKSVLDGDGDWKLGVMLRGIFNDQNMNWQTPNRATGIGWYTCQEGSNFHGNPALPVGTPKGIRFDTAAKLGGARFNNFKIQVYKLATVYDGNQKNKMLYEIDDFYLPNVVNTTNTSAADMWDRLNVRVKSVTATNILDTNPNLYSSELGIRHLKAFNTPSGVSHYIQDSIMDYGSSENVNDFEIVVAITGTDKDLNAETDGGGSKTINLVSEVGVLTTHVSNIQEPVAHINYLLNGFSLYRTELVNTNESKISIIQDDILTNRYPTTLKAIVDGPCDITGLVGRDEWITGMQIKEPTQRFSVVTDLCKQGFVAGFSSRKGLPTFVSFIESTKTPHLHNNNIILDKTLKSFTTTPMGKVYNEFNLKWNYNYATSNFGSQLSILKTKESAFPLSTGDWKSFVSGVPNYNTAKEYWTKAKAAYDVSKIINKAPNDRTELKFTYDDNITTKGINKVFISTVTNMLNVTEDLGGVIKVGVRIKLDYDTLDNNIIKEGDMIYLSDGVNNMTVIAQFDRFFTSARKFMCTVINTTFSQTLTAIQVDAKLCYVIVDDGSLLAGVRNSTSRVINGFEFNSIDNSRIKVGTECRILKTSLPSNAQPNNIYRLTFTDNDERVQCYADVKIVSELTVGNVHWKIVVMHIKNRARQQYSNIFNFSGGSSWIHKYYTISIDDTSTDTKYITDYLNLLLYWTTYQKFQVSYDLPITVDTVKYELADKVILEDPIITPNMTTGDGWITSLGFDSKKNRLKVQITFDPKFLVRPIVVECNNIIEHKNNIDTITESITNTDTITEQYCRYSN